jgi:hypothetical protein
MLAKAIAWEGLLRVTFNQGVTTATADLVDQTIFIATDCDYEIVGASEVHSAIATNGGTVSIDLRKSSSGTTVVAGTSVLASVFNAKSTADTPVHKTISNGGLASTQAGRTILKNQRLGVDFVGTLTALEGVNVTCFLRPVRRPSL